LQRIGRVLHLTRNKNLILKAENIPRIGSIALNEFMKPIGTVLDVFGPSSAPYVSVKSHEKDLQLLVGRVIYTSKHK
jgi:rRNA processing protein Gar1